MAPGQERLMTNRSILLLIILFIVLAAFMLLQPAMRMRVRQAAHIGQPDAYAALERDLARFKASGGYSVEPIGKSVLGRKIYAVSPYSVSSIRVAKLLVVAGQHGVEPLPVQSVMQMIGSGVFRRSKIDIAIIPVANPDGYPYGYRFNWNDVDLNRDWPNPTQPETIAISKFIGQYDPDVIIDLHEGRPYCIEIAQSTNTAGYRLAAAGATRAKAKGFKLDLLSNSSGLGSGLLHRKAGMQGRVGLMLETPMEYRDRLPAYTAFVSGVVDAMAKERWRM